MFAATSLLSQELTLNMGQLALGLSCRPGPLGCTLFMRNNLCTGLVFLACVLHVELPSSKVLLDVYCLSSSW